MLASPDTAKDVRKYFESTFIICPEVAANKALYLEYVNPEGMRVVDNEGSKGFIDYTDQPYEIKSPLVLKRQWFNSEYLGNAIMVQRIPARMWRKGICSENTQMLGFTSSGSYGSKVCDVKLSTVQDFLTNKESFPTKLAPEGMTSVALSPQWALELSKNMLYLYHAPVAAVSIPKRMITMLKEFIQLPLPPIFNDWTVKHV